MPGSASRYPFTPYPDGWYHVAASKDLAPGDVKPLRYLGRDLVLFRTQAGEAVVFDAHCPHLGAHLGVGGRVEGDSLRCPFHGWRFGADGACVEVPYRTRGRLPDAGVRRWRVDERSGLVLVWHSEAGDEPGWRMRDFDEYDSDAWLGYVTRAWKIRMHVQELAENVPDRAHFNVVHGVPRVPDTPIRIEGPVYYQTTQVPGEDGEPWVIARQELWGLGLTWLYSGGEPEVLFVVATTPIDEEYCELTQLLLVKDAWGTGEIPGEMLPRIDAIFDQTAADVPIWENKVYRERPALVEDDGPLPELRRWARQFYPELREA